MASNFKISEDARNDALQSLIDLLEPEPIVLIYINPGSPPADASGDPSLGGTQLWTAEADTPAFSTPSGGSTTASFPTTDISANGIAGHFRMTANFPAETVCQGTCGDAGDAPVDLEFNSKTLVAGGTCSASVTITMPE